MTTLIYQTVVGIVTDANQILLLKKQGKWIGWGFPQGAQEKNETKEQAILREIKEETNLSGKVIMELPIKLSYEYKGKFGEEKGKKDHKEETIFIIKANKNHKKNKTLQHRQN
ncbi:MAG: NUDIX hydrolase, partial [Candidatus Woesearchaeota archaeon]